jgi:glycosyltransferase involved in cell wall biosynthesis
MDFAYRIKSLALRYQLTVISTAPLTHSELLQPNVTYVVLRSNNGLLGWMAYLLQCARFIRYHKPNVAVLLHSMVAPVSLLVGNIPTATYWNEHPTHVAPLPTRFAPIKSFVRSIVRALMYRGAQHSKLVMPIGEAHRDDIIAHGCKPENVQMLYMGVDQIFYGAAMPPLSKQPVEPVQLIYVGSVHQDRGRDVMLEAIALSNKNTKIAHLTIIGATAEQLAYCTDIVNRLGLMNCVSIMCRVPGHEIPGYLRNADAGLSLWKDLSWFRFNPPTKLFEYLVAGLPVLASNIRTHTQYVTDGMNGFIFDYDSASLANAILRLHESHDNLRRMKQNALASSSAYLWPYIEPQFLLAISGVAKSSLK